MDSKKEGTKGVQAHGAVKDMPKEGTFKIDKNEVVLPAPSGELLLSVEESKEIRRQPVKNINFTRRIDREAKKNG
jgi:hypothetical protein